MTISEVQNACAVFYNVGATTTASGTTLTDTTHSTFTAAETTNAAVVWIKGAGTAGADYTGTATTPNATQTVLNITPATATAKSSVQYMIGDAGSVSSNGTTQFSIGYKVNTIAGNLLTLGVNVDNTLTISSVTDSAGNVWTAAAAGISNATAGYFQRSYYCLSAKGGACTVTVTTSGTSTQAELFLREANTTIGAWAFDQVATGNATNASVATGAFTTKFANEYIFAFVGVENGISANASGYTATPSYSMSFGVSGNLTPFADNAESKIVSTIQSGVTFSASQSPSGAFVVTATTFAEIPFLSASYPDRVPGASRQIEPGGFFTSRVVAVAVPTVAFWSYPDRHQQPHRAALETASFNPPPVVAARLSDAAPRSAYTDYPARLPRPTTAHPAYVRDASIDPLPRPTATVPTFFAASYPETARAPARPPSDWANGGLTDSVDVQGADWSYPDQILRPWRPDGHATLASVPERSSVYLDQDYPDRVPRAPAVAQQQDAAARPLAPERTAPLTAQNFPDRAPRALPVAQQQSSATLPLAPEAPLPSDWRTSYPDTVRAAQPVAQQRENAGAIPLAPERTAPYATASYPDRLDGAPFPARFQASLDLPPLPIPNTAAPVGAYVSFPDRFPRLGGLPTSQQQDSAARNLPPLVVVRTWDLTSYPERAPRAPAIAQQLDATQVPPLPIPNSLAPKAGYTSYPDQVLPVGGLRTSQQQVFTAPVRPEAKLPTPYTAYPERAPGAALPPNAQQASAALPMRPEAPAPSDWYASYPDIVRGRSLPTSQQQDAAARPLAPEAPLPSDWRTAYPDTVRGAAFPTTAQSFVASLPFKPIATPATPTAYPDIVYGRAFPPNAQQAFTISPQALIPPPVPTYFRNDYPDIVRVAVLPTAMQPWTSSWFQVVVPIDYLVVITLVATQAVGETLEATEAAGVTLEPTTVG